MNNICDCTRDDSQHSHECMQAKAANDKERVDTLKDSTPKPAKSTAKETKPHKPRAKTPYIVRFPI